MTFSIDNPRGVATTPLGKYVWEKPSGEQGLKSLECLLSVSSTAAWVGFSVFVLFLFCFCLFVSCLFLCFLIGQSPINGFLKLFLKIRSKSWPCRSSQTKCKRHTPCTRLQKKSWIAKALTDHTTCYSFRIKYFLQNNPRKLFLYQIINISVFR